MNNFNCPLCRSNCNIVVRPYRAKTALFANRDIVRCSTCGLHSTFPTLDDEELVSYYNNYWHEDDLDINYHFYMAQAEARYNFIKPFLNIDGVLNILDVGSGYGLINRLFSQNGYRFNYDVVEVDDNAISYLKNNIYPRSIYSEINISKEQYNLIIFSHILEHYKDPSGMIELCNAKMSKNAIIFIEVPNSDYLFKKYNEPHLTFFSPETLTQLMEKYNFEILNVNTCGTFIPLNYDYRESLWRDDLINIIKKIIPPNIKPRIKPILKKVETILKNRGNHEYLNQYGGNRRWIRLIARKYQ